MNYKTSNQYFTRRFYDNTVRFRCNDCPVGSKARSLSLMRNTTKLKQILMKYDLALSMEEDNLLKLSLVDKITGRISSFENSSYSVLLSKCYSHFIKELKKETVPLIKVAGKNQM